MLKKIQLLMLPTNQKATRDKDIVKLHAKGQSGLVIMSNYTDLDGYQQHLYFLSDEEIKEGDWVTDGKIVIQVNNQNYWNCAQYPKIIATTDSSLKIKSEYQIEQHSEYNLPQPSPSFIEKYIEKYNKGEQITEVQVEYEEGDECDCSCMSNTCTHSMFKLKVNPKDNCITIKPIKKNYTKDEVIALVGNCINTLIQEHKLKYNPGFLTKWIENNL